MYQSLDFVARLSVLVFVVTCMLSVGLSLRLHDIISSFRRTRLILLAAIANFVIAPAIAYSVTRLIALDTPYAIGLLLLGGAAGAPFLPKLAAFARGDVPFSVGLMLFLMVGSVAFMPLILPYLIPGMSADPWSLLQPLLLSMLLPLASGMAFRSRFERWSSILRPALELASNISMVLAVILLIAVNFEAMLATFGTGAVLAGVLFVLLSLAAGYVLGGPALGTRLVLGLGTGQRNVAAALLIATQNYSAVPEVAVMLLVTTLAGLVVLLLVAWWWARLLPVAPRSTPHALESEGALTAPSGTTNGGAFP